MTGGRKPRGYTIVEVLIFMAVSSLMFLLAATFINGKQNRVEFKQSINDINTQINGALNDVANGIYPSSVNFTCRVISPGTATSTPSFTSVATVQGANAGCTFIGKVVQLQVGGDSGAYNLFSLAGRQLNSIGAAVTNFKDARPIAVDSTATGAGAYFTPSTTANLTERRRLQYGLSLEKALLCSGDCSGGTPIGMFGFFGSLGNYGISSSADPQSGAQTVITAVIPGSSLGQSEPAAAQFINSNAYRIVDTDVVSVGKYILLCFRNGDGQGSVKIGGGNSQQLTTTLDLGAAVPAKCSGP